MPLPRRRRRESERKFMGRCMGWMHRSGEAERRYPANGQPAAVCYSQSRLRNGEVGFDPMEHIHANPGDEDSLAWAREQIRLCRCDPRDPCLACVRAEAEIREAATRRNPPLEDKALELAAKLAANARLEPRFMGQIAMDLEAVLAGTADDDTAKTYANTPDEVIEDASQLLMRLAYGITGDKPDRVKERAQEIIAELDTRENPSSPPLGGNAEFYREQWERGRDPEWGLRYAHALDREGSYERAREVYDELAGVYEQAGRRGMRAIARTRAGELASRRNGRRYYR
jgi:hypothetical protein